MCSTRVMFHRIYLIPDLLKSCKFDSVIWMEETFLITDCIKHHVHIYLLGQQVNNVFSFVVFTQFFSSMISLCTVVYELTCLSISNSTYWLMMSSMGSVLMQTFLYCYCGQKIIEKSTEVMFAIQNMQWTVLTKRGRKDLLIMMIRASRPIELHGLSIVIMSFKTFVNITKSTYSAFNLLNSAF